MLFLFLSGYAETYHPEAAMVDIAPMDFEML